MRPGRRDDVYGSDDPATPYTSAVRNALGELVVGDEYFAEVSVRVLALPLDPVIGDDIVCAEVFGGDCSSNATSSRRPRA